ncbi:DNA adenine methylase [Luteimonas sp. MC1895]|uniref:DNA adenine methylase n=1 Tax=Luteimonas sp. MC1895 TaxID=2819513 RepID=UPI0018F08C0B|nr:DNA adenine methylase [Luteimonas sp. MC1895]MBJ6978062.1 DNA adenine methylase [Luteimonas sp. MC1895]
MVSHKGFNSIAVTTHYLEDLLNSQAAFDLRAQGPLVALPRFPATRYQGSKRKVLPLLKQTFDRIEFASCIDLFSGTGTVTLLLRLLGKKTLSNDFLAFNRACARLFQTITPELLSGTDHATQLAYLIQYAPLDGPRYVGTNYSGVFFLDEENEQIDRFAQHIRAVEEPLQSLYIYAFGQALLKKRPYNLFHRSNLSMRTKDVKRSFGNAVTWETPAIKHALNAVDELRKFPLGDPIVGSTVMGVNTQNIEDIPNSVDLVYLDPPYVNSRGTGVDYSDFYGFLDGLCDHSLFNKPDHDYPHKPIGRQYSAWIKADSALFELERIRERFSSSVLVMSYRSDGSPGLHQINEVLGAGGRCIEVFSTGGYKYALSQAQGSDEIVIVASP